MLRFDAPQVSTVLESRVVVDLGPDRVAMVVADQSGCCALADTGAMVRILAGGGAGNRGRSMGMIFDLADLDQPPVIQSQPLPQYPPGMQHTGITGEVLVGFVVDAQGTVCKVRALTSSREEFELPAVQAVSRWRFKPGRKAGKAVATRMEAPIEFALAR